ncbi:MAG: hypothetical protein AMXMBFR33_34240 [Candidatus Xenobia bacterium]
MSLVSNGNYRVSGNLGPDRLRASVTPAANGTLFIEGELSDMPFRQTIERL